MPTKNARRLGSLDMISEVLLNDKHQIPVCLILTLSFEGHLCNIFAFERQNFETDITTFHLIFLL